MSIERKSQIQPVSGLHLALDMTNLSSGGSIAILLRYMELWAAHGIKMTVFYVRETIGSEIRASGLPVELIQVGANWPSWKTFLYRNFGLSKLIKKSGARILYCVNSMLMCCPIPQIAHMRNLQHFNSKSFMAQLLSGGIYEALRDWTCRHTVRHAEYNIFISNYLRDAALKLCRPRHPEGVSVIYNPISTRLLEESKRIQSPDGNHGNSVILGVLNDQPHKDTPTFLRTLALLRRNAPERDWQGVIIGNGKWETYDGLIAELGLQKCIHFPGYVPASQIQEYYRKAFCLLATSQLEGFNNTPLEAMACACPVVITRCTAHPEVAADAALYFTPGDAGEAAQRILELYHNTAEYAQYVRKGVENLTRFPLEDSVRQFEEIFQRILGASLAGK